MCGAMVHRSAFARLLETEPSVVTVKAGVCALRGLLLEVEDSVHVEQTHSELGKSAPHWRAERPKS